MCRLLLMTIALLLILFGISGFWMMPKLLQRKIEQRMELQIGTKNFERFTKVPIPLTVKFYLFNVTNSQQVLAGLERPKFAEVGPFMYKQWRQRDIVDFVDNNRRIVYKEFKTFYPMFSNDNTNNEYLNPKDFNVTIVNVPLLALLTKFAQLEEGSFKRNIIAKVVGRLIQDRDDKILVTKPANQILFDGYKVDFMESARDLVSHTLGFNFDSPLPGNTFGFFYGKNGTWSKRDSGEITIFTGRHDSMDDFFQIDNWNGLRELDVWPKNTIAGNRCNQIKGTDGSQFHPGVTRDQVLALFSPLVCRSLYIKYKEDTSAYDIPLLRFGTPAELFAAPKKKPENACFCTIQQDTLSNNMKKNNKSSGIPDHRCYLDGLMDLSLCQRGAPIAASSPHFYNADPMLALAANMNPQRDIHETFIDIEPMTGSVFRAASRAQLNAFIEKAALDVVDPSVIGHITPMVAPLMWLEERGGIDLKSSNEFKDKLLNLVLKVRKTFKYSIIIGIIMAVLVAVQYWYVTCYKFGKSSSKSNNNKHRRNLNINNSLNGSLSKRDKILKGKRLRENILLSTGARRSNLAAKLATEEELNDPELLGRSRKLKGTNIVIAAGVLGAAAGSSKNRKGSSNFNSPLKGLNNGEDDEDELSKRMLVSSEWVAGTSESSAGGRSSRLGFQADNQAVGGENSSNSDEDAIGIEDEDGEDDVEVDLMKAGTSKQEASPVDSL